MMNITIACDKVRNKFNNVVCCLYRLKHLICNVYCEYWYGSLYYYNCRYTLVFIMTHSKSMRSVLCKIIIKDSTGKIGAYILV